MHQDKDIRYFKEEQKEEEVVETAEGPIRIKEYMGILRSLGHPEKDRWIYKVEVVDGETTLA